LKKITLIFLLPILFICCSKSSSPGPAANLNTDSVKLVNKNWYWGGKSVPQAIAIRFNSNDTALLTECISALPPYKYASYKYPWKVLAKDSISLEKFPIKIYSISDSSLITSNWVVGGPNISDTAKMNFTTY